MCKESCLFLLIRGMNTEQSVYSVAPCLNKWSTLVVHKQTCHCEQLVYATRNGHGDDCVKQLVLLNSTDKTLNMYPEPSHRLSVCHFIN